MVGTGRHLAAIGGLMTVLLLAGCGGGNGGSGHRSMGSSPPKAAVTAGARLTGASPAFAGRAGRARFLSFAGNVCRAIREGAPPPLSGSPRHATIVRYARAAATAARRTVTSLPRLPTPTSLRPLVLRLTIEYRGLLRRYQALGHGPAPSGTREAALIRRMERAEQRTSADAIQGSLAACAPHPAQAP